jgi:hypothetical protein
MTSLRKLFAFFRVVAVLLAALSCFGLPALGYPRSTTICRRDARLRFR